MAKTAIKSAKRAVAANKQALASAKDTVKRPGQRGETFGPSQNWSDVANRLKV